MNDEELLEQWRQALLEPYSATVLLRTEFIGALAKPDFEYWWVIHPYGELAVNGAKLTVDSTAEGYVARLDGIMAVSCYEALDAAEGVFTLAVAALSLKVQLEYADQEHGHARLSFRRDHIQIDPWKSLMPGKGGVGSSHPVALDEVGMFTTGDADLRSLLISYYNALAPTAPDVKFYSAFATIEYIERRFGESIVTTPVFTRSAIDAAGDAVEKCLASSVAAPVAKQARDAFTETAASKTLESRAEKLTTILRDQLGIVSFAYRKDAVGVDAEFCQRLIRVRHSLFHAKKDSAELRADRRQMKSVSDQLMILTGQILEALFKMQSK
ncbi:MAG: hypothetical protein WA208_02100 [Thermoanaerobaculia bacterium]